MTAESGNTALSFGRYLQAIRVEKGISLKEISKETRIRLETLHHIEEEDHRHLPDEVYVKGFLRSYAKAIGADGEEAVQRYNSRLAVKRKIALSEAALYHTGGGFWRRLLLSLAAVLCLIAVTVYAVSAWRERTAAKTAVSGSIEQPPPAPAAETPVAVSVPPEEEKAPAAAPAAGLPSAPAEDKDGVAESLAPSEAAAPEADGRLRLTIDTIEETWLKAIVDDQRAKQYRLNPGDHIELEGTRNFNLLIGNAGGIRLALNGKAVALSGKSGQVVTLQLP
ncbi:MAG: RodZ domain-containing protein [Desulfobacterales bacterium]